MRIFQPKERTAETYLAGIGASGALMGSAFVIFVILIGAVTFDTWPHAGRLFHDGGDVALDVNSTSAPAPQPKTLNLVQLLGGGPTAGTRHLGGGGPAALIVIRGLPGSIGGSRGGSNGPSPGAGGQGPVSTPEPPSPPPPTQGRSLLSETVSDAGNTVQSGTESLGSTVNTATGTDLGNVVSGAGTTLNSGLQSLADQLNAP